MLEVETPGGPNSRLDDLTARGHDVLALLARD
jgi:hypothetical protein